MVYNFILFVFSEKIMSRRTILIEAEFDAIAAEWFRFAKQRKIREDRNKETIEKSK